MKASPNRLSDLLIRLSGHSPAIASSLGEAERIRVAALGMTLLLPVSIAGFGGFAAVYQASEGNLFFSVCAGLAVGLFTLLVDRALLASPMKKAGAILLRIVLTLVTSTVFAHTALLWLFSEKIEEEARAAKIRETSAIASELRNLNKSLENEGDVVSRIVTGQLELLSEELRRVSGTMARQEEELAHYRAQYEAEIAGRGISGKPGEGPESRRIQQEQIDPRSREISENRKKHENLFGKITSIQDELSERNRREESDAGKEARKKESDLLLNESLERSYNGILTRFVLLHEIIRKDRSALSAYALICALLLLWELLPLTLKLNARGSEYAKAEALEKQRAEALRLVEQENLTETAALESAHALRLRMMQLEEIEIERWTRQAENRFETVQEKRAAIPKRATPEQREAYLNALEVLMTSLQKVGDQLSES